MIIKIFKKNKLVFFGSLITLILVLNFYGIEVNASSSIEQDLKTIEKRLLKVSNQNIEYNKVKTYFNSLTNDGSWSDIDYSDNSMSDWEPRNHVQRLEKMVLYYKNNDLGSKKAKELKNKIISAYNFWLKKDPESENWWHNEIGVQKHFRVVLLNLKNELSRKELKNGLAVLKKSGKPRKTGQNLVDLTMTYIWRGIIQEKNSIVKDGFNKLAEEIKITTEQGIQPDYSFQQHGDLLYTGTYGRDFVRDMAKLAWLPSGTKFAFPEDKIKLFEDFILDGFRWIVYGRVIDYGTLGRGLTRKNVPDLYKPLIDMCDYMIEVSNDRTKAFKSFKKALKNNQANKPVGNKNFWYSDHMIHRRKNYYTSVKMVSQKTLGTESGNGEGLLNYHISDGFNMIMVDGNEYKNIFPVWDWNKIPGTTTAQVNENFPLVDWGKGARGLEEFVGGVSDGNFGIAAMQFTGKEKDVELKRKTVKSKKSWFFFEDEIVALGSDINYSGGNEVLTSINQANLRGRVFVKNDDNVDFLKRDKIVAEKSPDWVFHDNIAYYFLNNKQKVYLKNDSQSGNWAKINNRYSNTGLKRKIFSLGIKHGFNPKNEKYEYVIMPDIEINKLLDYEEEMPIKVISNNSKLQAVTHKKLNITGLVFHKAGKIKIENKLTVKVDNPVLLMLKQRENSLKINIANPLNLAEITLEINRQLKGENVTWSDKKRVSEIKFKNNSEKNIPETIEKSFKIIN